MPFDAVETQTCGDTPVLLFCDHATNRVPADVAGGDLGLPDADMQRHIAFDVGAEPLTRMLCQQLGGSAVYARFSRLVIDPNRGEDDPTLIMQLYDGSVVPGNRLMTEADRTHRLNRYHRPYHGEARNLIDQMSQAGTRVPVLISIHSFTSQLRGKPPRPWHIGVLYGDDRHLADLLMARLALESDIVVGDNLPYSGKLTGDCMETHGIRRGLPHVLVEVRNDLIGTPEGQDHWANRLSPMLQHVMNEFWEKEHAVHG